MGEHLLTISVLVVYGPFLLMVSLYLAALVLRVMGWPELLRTLIERTGPQAPVVREGPAGH